MGLLDNKVALVTGGTSGIGSASALLFAKEGARVVITGRRTDEGDHVVKAIKAAGGEAAFVQADLTDIAGIPNITEHVVALYGRLDCAFNNAGVSGGGPIETLDEAVWDRVVDTNLKTAFFCMKAEAEQMRRQGEGGSILFNASVLAHIGALGTSIYSASKGGIASMARAAAVELGPVGIRVNTLSPSVTRTPMTAPRMIVKDDGSLAHPLATNIPLGRVAEAEEMAQVAAFLLSDRASYVSGQYLLVDGGLSAA